MCIHDCLSDAAQSTGTAASSVAEKLRATEDTESLFSIKRTETFDFKAMRLFTPSTQEQKQASLCESAASLVYRVSSQPARVTSPETDDTWPRARCLVACYVHEHAHVFRTTAVGRICYTVAFCLLVWFVFFLDKVPVCSPGYPATQVCRPDWP